MDKEKRDNDSEQQILEEGKEFISFLIKTLNKLVDENTVVVIGGKSKKVVESILDVLIDAQVLHINVIRAWEERIRLKSEENKATYSSDHEVAYTAIEKDLGKALQQGKKILFIDDHISKGRKAFHLISNISALGGEASFLALSGKLDDQSNSDYLRPIDWKNFKECVYAFDESPYISNLLLGASKKMSFAVRDMSQGNHSEAKRLAAFVQKDLEELKSLMVRAIPQNP